MTRRGVTLIEVLITIVIGAIAFFAAAMPFIAERSFWGSGNRQAEAQRDAQMAVRAMARVARESNGYTLIPGGVTFHGAPTCGGGDVTFEVHAGGVFHQHCGGTTSILIDGVRSKMSSFTPTQITANTLVQIALVVTHQLQATNPTTRSETLVTNLYLRNAP